MMDRNKLEERIVARRLQIENALDSASGQTKTELDAEFQRLSDLLDDILIADADQLAKDISAAAAALDQIRTAHPLDALSVLGGVIDGLREDARKLADGVAAEGAAPSFAGAPFAVTVAAAFETLKANKFAALQNEYANFFGQCQVRPGKQVEIDKLANRVRANKARYEAVGEPLDIPWRFIGIVHALEGSLNFKTHLHNGDPLTARTAQVPAGRPMTGSPPFTWEESATDALRLEGLDQNTDWSLPRILFLFERYNGFGYRRFKLPSPYLWSFSNIYEKGKFGSDGDFDPSLVSKQCGAALLLKALS